MERRKNLKEVHAFDEQIGWLKSIGIDCERLDIKSAASITENAGVISAAVKASTQPVIIIGHSKGGLEALLS